MDKNPYAPPFSSLPASLPIFPLTGVLLLPNGQLPLNIFEPRYLAMVEDALASNRLIGMIQLKDDNTLYQTGCAGKITEFAELANGRFVINLTGINRFRIETELKTVCAYRIVKPDWSDFQNDDQIPKSLGVCRETLLNHLCSYFKAQSMSCDFDKFSEIEDSKLITTLAMVCPFEPTEKQAILEEICHVKRAKTFMAMLEMAARAGIAGTEAANKHH